MWFERTVSARIRRIASEFPAVLVAGARQVGKTSVLRETFAEASFVSLDLPSVAEQAELSPDDFFATATEPMLIDEVQYSPGIFRHIKARIDADRHRMGRFLMMGSQRFPLMKAVSDSLAGRCAIVELGSLSAAEIRAGLKKDAPSEAELVHRGGMPELWRNRKLSWSEYFSSYVATYLERDVRTLSSVGSLRDFERFLRACAARSGGLLNLSDLARDVGIAISTARDWIGVLDTSRQIVLLEPYFANVGKRLIKAPKLYLTDTGLLCFLLGIGSAAALERSPFAGAVWETFVLQQIMAFYEGTGTVGKVYFFRDAQGTEVDFLLEGGENLRLVEAKWTEEPTSEKTAKSIAQVSKLLGRNAQGEHWIACRTARARRISGAVPLRLVNGATVTDWS